MSLKCPAILPKIALLLSFLTLCACAAMQKPLTGLIPGREMETLQSSIAITMKSGEHGSGGHGFLIFKYPDRFHLAVLSPFGSTLLDLFSDGERLTCQVASRQTAYVGLISELPESGEIRMFGLLKWVVARVPPYDPLTGAGALFTDSGDRITFDKYGLVQKKISPEGDLVDFAGYRNVNGVAFPESLALKDRNGDTVRITFEEPEINKPVEDAVLTPNLEGIKVRPLSEFRGL